MSSKKVDEFTKDILSSDPNKLVYDFIVAKEIFKLGGIKTAYDFGCGSGIYTDALIQFEIDTLGIDNNTKMNLKQMNTKSKNIRLLDLSKDLTKVLEPRDLVLSIETAEHIKKNKVNMFFRNVCELATKWIFLTASPDKGKYHVNPQPRNYWINKVLKSKKFIYKSDLSNKMMNKFQMKIAERYGLIWFKRDLMIFEAIL